MSYRYSVCFSTNKTDTHVVALSFKLSGHFLGITKGNLSEGFPPSSAFAVMKAKIFQKKIT